MKQFPLVSQPAVAEPDELTLEQKLAVRAAANEWISANLPSNRKFISHSRPEFNSSEKAWTIILLSKDAHGSAREVGRLVFEANANLVEATSPGDVRKALSMLRLEEEALGEFDEELLGKNFEFRLGDGVAEADLIHDHSIDLLLTDPPYGISKEYTCETQVPRRLRKDGTDFIMPRGHFGDWDGPISPSDWTSALLPKVRGWFVTFCAQAQIGEYCDILQGHKFVAVGTLVWQKTNPVPFNHRYKPINAWEALVIGKRPGTKFNGRVVHNVFLEKSPSPQQRIHPTQKPLPLIERFIELFSDEGDFVYDPFAGSATTLVAAVARRRRVLAYERDRAIYQSACKRILAAQG